MNMKIKKILFLLLLICNKELITAQNIKYGNLNTWFTLLNRVQIGEKWSFSNEIHERMGNLFSEQGYFLERPSIDYHINKNTEFSLGYTYIHSWPFDPYYLPIQKSENNIWEQFLLKYEIGKVKFQNRFRQENRWTDNIVFTNNEYKLEDITYNNRFRFRITANFDLITLKKNDKVIFFCGFDEIWVNQDKYLRPISFGRNWLYLALGFKFKSNTNVQIGYMNQMDKTGNDFINSPIIQTTFQHKLTIKSKKE